MGKKGSSSNSSANSKPATATPVEEPTKRPPRGHRQKGAGTVIVAKPPTVTTDGIVLAPHMRLPSVLVREHCQREKRPLPVYFDSRGPNQQTCLLKDPKNSKDDLKFCPVQHFETPMQAKEYASLLALFHLQPTLPLERRLPEPYATAWKDMTRRPTPGNASQVTGKAVSSNERKQTEAIASVTDLNTNSSPIAAVGTVKATHAPVLGLRAATSFASKAAQTQADRERVVNLSRKKAYFDAVRRANKPESVFMTTKLRTTIEEALGIRKLDSAVQGEEAHQFADVNSLDVLVKRLASCRVDSVAGLLAAVISVHGVANLTQNVFQELSEKLLFRRDVVLQALCMLLLSASGGAGMGLSNDDLMSNLPELLDIELKRSLEVIAEAALDEGSGMFAQKEAIAQGLLRDYCLEFLCLHMEESELPEAFEGQNNIAPKRLAVIGPTSLEPVEGAHLVTDAEVSFQRAISSLYGFDENEVMAKISSVLYYLRENSLIDASDEIGMSVSMILSGCGAAAFSEAVSSSYCRGEIPEPRIILPVLLALRGDIVSALRADDFLEVARSTGVEFTSDDIVCLVESELDALLECYPGISLKSFDCFSQTNKQLNSASDAVSDLLEGHWLICSVTLDTGKTSTNTVLEVFLPPQSFFQSIGVAYDVLAKYPVSCMAIPILRSGPKEAIQSVSVELWVTSVGLLGACALGQLMSDARAMLAAHFKISLDNAAIKRYSDLTKADEKSVVTTIEDASISACSGGRKRTAMHLTSHPFWRRSDWGRPKGSITVPNEATRRLLPAWGSRDAFISLATSETAMIVTGETGCGKTTQIPQYLLEHYHQNGKNVKILVCQPRRLAAVGVATRVAEERVSRIGGEVGYMVRGDCQAGIDTCLLFCTYGVLLRRLQDDEDLAGIDFIVLDEVHERGLESDFSLGLLMKVLRRRNDPAVWDRKKSRLGSGLHLPPLRLILMSATIQTDKFVAYLNTQMNRLGTTPVHHIPGYTYPVTEFFRGDFEPVVRPQEDAEGEVQQYRYGGWAKAGDIDYDLLIRLILKLVSNEKSSEDGDAMFPTNCPTDGCILVFMPGVSEISRLLRLFEEAKEGRPMRRVIASALHGALSPAEQARVFRPAPSGSIKLVVSTNVAEASVTIPDVIVVIDTCKVKNMIYDEERQMPSLVTAFASKDSLRQRRGRAGRVQAGRCFRMIHSRAFEKIPEHGVPDILRTPIERLVLQVLAMAYGRARHSGSEDNGCMPVTIVRDTLALCPDPPSPAQVEQAVYRLQALQAVPTKANAADSQLLTSLGRHIAVFPCSPLVGKLLLFGAILGCIAPVSAVAACMTVGRDPFDSRADEGNRGAAKARFVKTSGCGNSDHLVLAEVVRLFRAAGFSKKQQRQLCEAHGLSLERLSDICKTQDDLLEGLMQAEFIPSVAAGLCEKRDNASFSTAVNGNSNDARVVCATLCAGLYPHVCQVLQPPKRFVDTIGGALEKSVAGTDLKYYIKLAGSAEKDLQDSIAAMMASSDGAEEPLPDESDMQGLQRVFLHPGNASVLAADNGAAPNFSSRYFAPGRVVALVRALRRALDDLLDAKIDDPTTDVSVSPVTKAVVALLKA